jgi:hypothetical protein
VSSTDDSATLTNNKSLAQETNRGANVMKQLTTVEERVEQIVMDYVQRSRTQPAEAELVKIREKAEVWEIWDRLRRAYQDEP